MADSTERTNKLNNFMYDINVVTFNCNGFKSSIPEVTELTKKYDIIGLQEIWLCQSELHILSSTFHKVIGSGSSPNNPNLGLTVGRKYGGVAFLYNEDLKNVRCINYNEDWILGLEITNNEKTILILNIYLPYECNDNNDAFLECLGKIQSIIQSSNNQCIYMIGDFNANLVMSNGKNKSVFGEYLKNFAKDGQYVISDLNLLPSNSYTYVSYSWNTYSWLDHCVSTAAGHNSIKNIEILYNYISSDHKPMKIEIDFKKVPHVKNNNHVTPNKINWNNIKSKKRLQYKMETRKRVEGIKLPTKLLHCADINCKSSECKHQIDSFYNDIVNSLSSASNRVFQYDGKNIKRRDAVSGWNVYVKESHTLAREAFQQWHEAGKPRLGPVAETIRKTRLHFKYALRFCRRNKDMHTSDALASKLLSKNKNDFWKEVNRVKNHKPTFTTTLNGVTGEQNIANVWKSYYSDIFSSVPSSNGELPYLNQLDDTDYTSFSFHDVSLAIDSLNSGKSADCNGISVEHIANSDDRVIVLITLCLNSMMKHGYLPSLFMQSVITPIVKNKNGDISDTSNYRPITVASTISKILEKILLEQIKPVVMLSANQFGFKKKHSTDMCNLILKETIRYYRSHGSNVFACFMDASKAFDRVNHRKLFDVLYDKNVSKCIIRIIQYWYCNQQIRVRWGNCLSELFDVKNGVRQGGVLSPILFNLYVDIISVALNKENIGCMIGKQLLNHLFFADDLVIIAPSHKALQRLVNICYQIGVALDIKFNENKTMCMVIRAKEFTNFDFLPILLNGKPLKFCKSIKYLGHVITDTLEDNDDVMRQTASIYARGNMIINTFKFCTDEVKCNLYKTYISNFYTTQLWCNYTKAVYHKFKMAYNNTFRMFFNLDRLCSVSGEMNQRSIGTCNEIQHKLMCSLYRRIFQSGNDLMVALLNSDIVIENVLFKHMFDAVMK